MIEVSITNDLLKLIVSIETQRSLFKGDKIPQAVAIRLRKLSMRKSTRASTKIEGNPLTESQVDAALESEKRHFLKPEEEVRNYYSALEFLDKHLERRTPFSKKLILDVQKRTVKGEGAEKVGVRGPMPPGVLFAVYDAETGAVEYIPPEAADIEGLLDELVSYVNTSPDHPLLKAGVIHYQLATIHPFEDGNGRTARIMSGYYLDLMGFGFGGVGSLEEYYAYDIDEYYRALQMGLPALYYEGRDNPPRPEVWMSYFLRMVELYAKQASSLVEEAAEKASRASLSHLKPRERALYEHLLKNEIAEFAPIEMARVFGVSNRTIINWCARLAANGLLQPQLVKQRIRTYRVVP